MEERGRLCITASRHAPCVPEMTRARRDIFAAAVEGLSTNMTGGLPRATRPRALQFKAGFLPQVPDVACMELGCKDSPIKRQSLDREVAIPLHEFKAAEGEV